MIKCATSLWSADLTNLERDIKRVEPYTDRFHLDVIDGQYLPVLLFFPDLVKAMRKHTRLPLEVHLMAVRQETWIGPFAEAGADSFILAHDTAKNLGQLISSVRDRGKGVGVGLRIEEPLELIEPYLDRIDVLTIFGTQLGIKGVGMDESVPAKIRAARRMIDARKNGRRVEIQCDGGIRRNTVPLMRAAGVDCIVPGSLMFGEDPAEVRMWLASLDAAPAPQAL